MGGASQKENAAGDVYTDLVLVHYKFRLHIPCNFAMYRVLYILLLEWCALYRLSNLNHQISLYGHVSLYNKLMSMSC